MKNNHTGLKGAVWVFEGPDGVGKSSIVQKVAKQLRKQGTKVCTLSFPGQEKHSTGKLVYDLHHTPELFNIYDISPFALQLFHIAAHIDCIENSIKSAIDKDEVILLDRFWWSTWVYGITAGIKQRPLKKAIDLEKYFWRKISIKGVFLIQSETPLQSIPESSKWDSLVEEYEKLSEHSSFKIERINNKKGRLDNSVGIINKIINDNMFPNLDIIVKRSEIKKTIVYDTYWRFAAERQNIFFKRARGEEFPWTSDPILKAYKFTNAYRASDRVSQYLIKDVIYDKSFSGTSHDIFFRIILFKLFNKIQTWELLKNSFDEIIYENYDFRQYDKILSKAINSGNRIYSGAYIMPSGKSSFGNNFKHQNNLKLLEYMMHQHLPERIADASSMSQVFDMLKACPTIGDFLAYQLAIDLNYSILTDFDEMSFVFPGPGAKDGLKKCFGDNGGFSEVDLIKKVTYEQEDEFERRGIKFKNLCGRDLQLIDCQNLFCEVDKYSRVAHPELSGITGRTRIKQKLKINLGPIEYFYPPKWNLNKQMQEVQENVHQQGILL